MRAQYAGTVKLSKSPVLDADFDPARADVCWPNPWGCRRIICFALMSIWLSGPQMAGVMASNRLVGLYHNQR